MHQTRAELTKKIPLPRKGTKYIARAKMDLENSVPVVIAIRDMLKLARTAKEVREMIKQKSLKLNGKEVKDYRESVRLFNILEAGDSYVLTLTPSGKFALEKTKEKERLCKVINKTSMKGNKLQINLSDGSNVLSSDAKIKTNDSLYLDFDGKIKKHITFEKGKEFIVISGKYLGNKGKILSVEENKIKVKLNDKDVETELNKKGVAVL